MGITVTLNASINVVIDERNGPLLQREFLEFMTNLGLRPTKETLVNNVNGNKYTGLFSSTNNSVEDMDKLVEWLQNHDAELVG